MLDIKKFRYPEIESIIRQYPNPEILLGHEIFWQEKRDGSNLGVYLDDQDNLKLRSRNLDDASEDFYRIFTEYTKESDKVKELLLDLKYQWHDDSIVFGELLMKGKSPTKMELHEDHQFVMFDVLSGSRQNYQPYMLVHQYAFHFDIPVVELYGTSSHTTLESLLSFRDKMLEKCKETKREGVVGKIVDGSFVRFFKEKLDTPKIEKLPRQIDEGVVLLPQLADSEITGALEKVLTDFGFEKFRDKRFAMPKFAEYVALECEKHNCRNSLRLFDFYNKRLEELKEVK